MKRVTPWLLWLVGWVGLWGCSDGDPAFWEWAESLDGGLADADLRPPISALPVPPPIAGGGLAVGAGRAVVADADHDRIRIFDLDGALVRDLRATRPGRIALAPDRAYVARAGGVDAIALADGRRVGAMELCPSPRGLAVDGRSLWVACLGGALHRRDRDTGGGLGRWDLPPDLRDVVVVRGRPWVSRFRTAEILVLDGDEHLPLAAPRRAGGGSEWQGRVGWRLRALPDGRVVLLHQWHRLDRAGSSYQRGLAGCDGGRLVPGMTVYHPRPDGLGASRVEHRAIAGSPLIVDFAVAGERVGLATPGDRSFRDPFTVEPGPQPLRHIPLSGLGPSAQGDCVLVRSGGAGSHRTVAVADVGGDLLYFDRGWLSWLDRPAPAMGEPPLFDSGHDYFHVDAGGGVTCAGCHPEGGDDGHVWPLPAGPRRTQPLHCGLSGTAPFHWDGLLADFQVLFAAVRDDLMGGGPLTEAQARAFSDWLDAIAVPEYASPYTDGQIDVSRRHFARLGCAECHGADGVGDGASHAIDGMAVQTPRLSTLRLRAALTHRGCAPGVRERLAGPGVDCGDPVHGPLPPADVEALIPFLMSR